LDIRTLAFVTVFTSVICGLGLSGFAHRLVRFRGLKVFASGMLLVGIGFLLMSLRDALPAVLSVVAANAGIFGGLVVMNEGVCRFMDWETRSVPIGIGLGAILCVLFVYLTFIAPSVHWRIVVVSLFIGVQCALCARDALRPANASTRAPRQIIALGFALLSAFMLFRTVWTLFEGEMPSFMGVVGVIHSLAFVFFQVMSLFVTVGMVWWASVRLQAELRRFERIISATPDHISLLDRDGAYRLVNDSYLQLLGLERDDILGRTSADLVGEEYYRNVTLPNLEKAFRGETRATAEWIDLPRVGPRYYLLTYHPVFDEDGSISYVALNARDMTELQQAQKERQRIFEMSLDMLCIAGLDGYLKELNPAWTRVLGWSQEELKASPWIDFVHPDDVQATLEAGAVLGRGEPVVDFINRYRAKSGEYRSLSWTSLVDPATKNIYCVVRDVTERMQLEEELRLLTVTDPLTGAGNRRLFMRRADEELERSLRYGDSLSLLMFDLDLFKLVNDKYGHSVGDEALKALVRECRKHLRNTDILCRMGGEEFAALLIKANQDAAIATAERIRESVERMAVRDGDKEVRVTVSIGVSAIKSSDDSVDALLRRADKALYEAKGAGRNRVVAAPAD